VFDRVLVDAPCSGEGMFRKSSVARQEWSEGHVHGCAVRQELLLDDAATMVKPGGLLLYSTCTFAPEENEQQVCRFLDEHSGWELVDIPKSIGLSPGRPEWAGAHCAADVSHMARIWPHRAPGEGHTMALLRAPWDQMSHVRAVPPRRPARAGNDAPSNDAITSWEQFRATNLPAFEPGGTMVQRGEQLFLIPPDTPATMDVRVVRPGLSLGRVRRGRFEPSHALAMTVRAETATETVALDEPEAARYLHGETVRISGPPGWVLITIEGFSLGWGKRTRDTVKNHYPKGLRW
jgi:NOL1/NOP2/fmu family ribosome biogenesis protein